MAIAASPFALVVAEDNTTIDHPIDDIANDVDDPSFWYYGIIFFILVFVGAYVYLYFFRKTQLSGLARRLSGKARQRGNKETEARLLEEGESAQDESCVDKIKHTFAMMGTAALTIAAIGAGLLVWSIVATILNAMAKAAAVFVASIMLYTQLGTIATYFRMKAAMADFKNNNADFEKNLVDQEVVVKGLKQIADAFEKFDKDFGGSLDTMEEEIERLEATQASQIKGNVKTMLRLYVDKDRDRHIDISEDGNAELHEALQLIEDLHIAVCPDIKARIDIMEKIVRQKCGAEVKTRVFADVVADMITAKSVDDVKAAVENSLAEGMA